MDISNDVTTHKMAPMVRCYVNARKLSACPMLPRLQSITKSSNVEFHRMPEHRLMAGFLRNTRTLRAPVRIPEAQLTRVGCFLNNHTRLSLKLLASTRGVN